MRLNGWEWIIILVIVLLLWETLKRAGLARSLAQSLRVFKKEMKTDESGKSEGEKPSDK